MSRIGSVVMRLSVVPLCAIAIVFSFTARADEVEFKNGGKVSGTIVEVAFRADGKVVKYAREDISMFYFSATRPDALTLTSGKKVEGAIVSVVVKTTGGKMTFKGIDLADVVLQTDPVAEARRSILAMRRAKIAPDDAKGLLELAKWAREKELAAEAEALAKAAMQVDLKSDVAAAAHKFLGHVLYDGEWMTKSEMVKRKRIDEGRLPSVEETVAETAKLKVSVDAEKADAARLKAAENTVSPAIQNEQVSKVFIGKVERIRRRHLKSVYATYNVVRSRLTAQIKRRQAAIKKSKAGQRTYSSVHVRDTSGTATGGKTNKAVTQANKAIVKLKGQRARLDMAKRRRVAGISKKAAIRKKRVLATRIAISQKLAAGEEVSLAQMVASYKKALK